METTTGTTGDRSPLPVGSPLFAPAAERVAEAFSTITAALGVLRGVDCTALDDESLEQMIVAVTAVERSLPSVRDLPVAEALQRGLPAVRHARGEGAYLRELTRCSGGDAAWWVRRVDDLVGRVSPTGHRTPARFDRVARACAAGLVPEQSARRVCDTLRKLPKALTDEQRSACEQDLVDAAVTFCPDQVRPLAARLADCYDPDGNLGSDPAEQAVKRGLRVGAPTRAGMVPVEGMLEPATAALLQAALDPWAAPRTTTVDGKTVRDSRSQEEQRNHDALHAICEQALECSRSPHSHGTASTLLLTITLDDLEHRTGAVSTHHGGTLAIRDLLRLAASMGVIPVVYDSDGTVLHHGRAQRLATEAQRHALWLMDLGCVWEGCDLPAAWCQTAHAEAFADGGTTDLPNLALLCQTHHGIADHEGWQITREHGRAGLVPPAWIDRERRPRYNPYHHLPKHHPRK